MAEEAAEKGHGLLKKSGLLLSLLAIAEGYRKGKDIKKALEWGEEKLDECLAELEERGLAVKVEVGEGAEDVYELTEKGREELGEMYNELAEETEDFLKAVKGTLTKHLEEIVPKVDIDVSVEHTEEA